MTVTTTQKIIKVGSSLAVTIPSKEAKRAGLKPGDEMRISYELPDMSLPHEQLMDEYQKFVKQYGQTLKNLAQR